MDSPAAYYTTPTPGAVERAGGIGACRGYQFQCRPGLFRRAVSSRDHDGTPEAEIRYTLDGSVPTATTGTIYTEPIHISSTTVSGPRRSSRAISPANVDTQTYLFLDDVLQQNETFGIDGSGLPPYAAWGHAGPTGKSTRRSPAMPIPTTA